MDDRASATSSDDYPNTPSTYHSDDDRSSEPGPHSRTRQQSNHTSGSSIDSENSGFLHTPSWIVQADNHIIHGGLPPALASRSSASSSHSKHSSISTIVPEDVIDPSQQTISSVQPVPEIDTSSNADIKPSKEKDEDKEREDDKTKNKQQKERPKDRKISHMVVQTETVPAVATIALTTPAPSSETSPVEPHTGAGGNGDSVLTNEAHDILAKTGSNINLTASVLGTGSNEATPSGVNPAMAGSTASKNTNNAASASHQSSSANNTATHATSGSNSNTSNGPDHSVNPSSSLNLPETNSSYGKSALGPGSTVSIASTGNVPSASSLSLANNASKTNLNSKNNKQRKKKRANTKAEKFAARVASAMDEQSKSSDDEMFVYESARPRFQSRHPSNSSLHATRAAASVAALSQQPSPQPVGSAAFSGLCTGAGGAEDHFSDIECPHPLAQVMSVASNSTSARTSATNLQECAPDLSLNMDNNAVPSAEASPTHNFPHPAAGLSRYKGNQNINVCNWSAASTPLASPRISDNHSTHKSIYSRWNRKCMPEEDSMDSEGASDEDDYMYNETTPLRYGRLGAFMGSSAGSVSSGLGSTSGPSAGGPPVHSSPGNSERGGSLRGRPSAKILAGRSSSRSKSRSGSGSGSGGSSHNGKLRSGRGKPFWNEFRDHYGTNNYDVEAAQPTNDTNDYQSNTNNTIMNGLRRGSRKGPNVDNYSPHNYQRKQHPQARSLYYFRLLVYSFIVGLCVLSSGFILGFLLATSKPLKDVSAVKLFDVVVSDELLAFELVIQGSNPGFLDIAVDNVEIDVFARSTYVDDESIQSNGGWNWPGAGNGQHTMLLGTVSKLDTPLVFEGRLFDRRPEKSLADVKVHNPGRNVSTDAIDEGQKKWQRVNSHPFELIARGTLKYKMFFGGKHSAPIAISLEVDPSQLL